MNANAIPAAASTFLAAAILSLLSSSSTLAADPHAVVEVRNVITNPSDDVTLSFDRPGRVVELPVKVGDVVKAGQMVAKQDDSEEQAALALAKVTAEDDTTIKAEQAVLDQKRVDYDNLMKNGGASHYEIDQARLEVTVEEAKVKLQQFTQTQNQYKYQQTKAAADKTKVFSPIAGIVLDTKVQVGESVDSQSMKVVRIVNLDPLWLDVPVQFGQAEGLKIGDEAQVTLSNNEVRAGHVIHIAAVAESSSETLLVRVAVPNPNQRKAGERVTVSFPSLGKVASIDK